MSITPSEDLLNRMTEAAKTNSLLAYRETMSTRLTLEGCFSDYDDVDKTMTVLLNGHIIAKGSLAERHLIYFDALKFIVARERLKGKSNGV